MKLCNRVDSFLSKRRPVCSSIQMCDQTVTNAHPSSQSAKTTLLSLQQLHLLQRSMGHACMRCIIASDTECTPSTIYGACQHNMSPHSTTRMCCTSNFLCIISSYCSCCISVSTVTLPCSHCITSYITVVDTSCNSMRVKYLLTLCVAESHVTPPAVSTAALQAVHAPTHRLGVAELQKRAPVKRDTVPPLMAFTRATPTAPSVRYTRPCT